MIKWLKRKIEEHNERCDDYCNWEDYWTFKEWITDAILSIVIPIGMSVIFSLSKNNWWYLFWGIGSAFVLIMFLSFQIELFSFIKIKKSPYVNDNIKFIWGVKSWDDLSGNDASLYTMNDLELTYDSNTDMYSLGIETIYEFEHGKIGEVKYLIYLLKSFTDFMNENNYNINEPYFFAEGQPKISLTAKTIPELYTQFRIFVEGYNSIYGGVENETVLCE